MNRVERDNLAIELATGIPGNDLAKKYEVSAARISQLKKQLKPKIEALSLQYFAQSAEHAVNHHVSMCREANNILEHAKTIDDKEERAKWLNKNVYFLTVADKAVMRVLRDTGISASPAPSVYISNMFVGGQQTILSPTITDLFAGVSCGDDDVIDVDCRESVSGSVGNDELSPDNLSCQRDDE
jgi:hypothetical protein